MNLSIRSKITLMTLLLVTLSLFTLGLLTYEGMEKSELENTKKEGFTQVKNVNDYFLRNFMADMEYIVDRWSTDPSLIHYRNFPGQEKMVHDVPSHFRPVTDSWMGTISSNPDVAWMYFGNEIDGSLYLSPLDPSMPLDYDCRTRNWYKSTVHNDGKVIWTEPYLDAGDSGEIIVTVAKSVMKGDQLIGVFGIDLKLSKFSEIIQTLAFVENGSLMLIGNDGYVFAHPDSNMLSKKLNHESWATEALSSSEGSYITEYKGADAVVSFIEVPNTEWKLIGISPLDLSALLMPIRNKTYLVSFISLIISLLIGNILSKNLTEPASIMVEAIQKASSGNYDVRANISSQDEFQVLGDHFNTMIYKTKQLIQERNKHVEALTEKNLKITNQQQEIMQYSEETIALNDELTQLVHEIRNNYLSTVRVLANAIEASDEYTRGHCDRVSDISMTVARRMDLPLSDLNNLEFACMLHDIGKIGIPDEVLNKCGRLDPDEYELIKQHPFIGYQILKDVDFLEKCSDIIVQHHERYDGRGYPYNLSGEEIEITARILTVADAYDAMTSNRPYRTKPMDQTAAMAELIKGKGTQFDAHVVDVFLDMLLENPQKFDDVVIIDQNKTS